MRRPHPIEKELKKYYVEVDENNYVLAINQTGRYELDTIPLDLSKYDLAGERMHTYQLINGTLIQDKIKLAKLIAEEENVKRQERIAYLKERLYETDYIMSRAYEEIMELENPLTWIADVIKIDIKYKKLYIETLKNRKEWRKEIEELGG